MLLLPSLLLTVSREWVQWCRVLLAQPTLARTVYCSPELRTYLGTILAAHHAALNALLQVGKHTHQLVGAHLHLHCCSDR